MPDKPDITALLGSRICHDLISPIGAISNGVELLLMEGAKGPEMALVAESVGHANARIRFFRIAFGQSGPDQRIGRNEVASVLADLSRGGRLEIVWHGPADLLRREVKLAFLLILCLESALGSGGQITVDRDETGWQITGRAARLRVDPALWALLTNPAVQAEVGPAQVQFLLAPAEVAQQGKALTVEMGEGEIRLRF